MFGGYFLKTSDSFAASAVLLGTVGDLQGFTTNEKDNSLADKKTVSNALDVDVSPDAIEEGFRIYAGVASVAFLLLIAFTLGVVLKDVYFKNKKVISVGTESKKEEENFEEDVSVDTKVGNGNNGFGFVEGDTKPLHSPNAGPKPSTTQMQGSSQLF